MFALMMRKKNKDPFGATEMKKQAREIDCIIWQRRYIAELIFDYPKVFEVADSAASNVQKVQGLIQSPMAMYTLMDSEKRDNTFCQSLPSAPLPLFCKHLHD